MENTNEPGLSNDADTSSPQPETKKKKVRKPLISPSSSFVDFSNLEKEIYTSEDKENNDYDPYVNRTIRKPITDFETVIHIVKGCIGAGILAMPRGFYYAGVGVSFVGTFVLGLFLGYGIHVMMRMKYLICKWLRVPFLALPRAMRVALLNGPPPLRKIAWAAAILTDLPLVLNQIGLCTAYVLFIADSFKKVLEPDVLPKMNVRIYLIVLFFPTLLVNYIRNLKRLSFVSLLGNVLMATAITLCFYYIFAVGPWAVDTPGQIDMFGPIGKLPLFISITVFAIDAVGVMITLEHNMKKPAHFLGKCGCFPWSMVFIVILYAAVGLCTYLKHGQKTGKTMVAALPSGEILSNACQIIVAVGIFNSYPLQMYVGLEIIWGNYLTHYIDNRDREYIYEYIMRTLVVVLTFLLAMISPEIDLVIALVSATCLSVISIVVPFLLELCTRYPNYGCCKYVMIKDIIFIIFGFLIMVIGTYVAVTEIIESFKKEFVGTTTPIIETTPN